MIGLWFMNGGAQLVDILYHRLHGISTEDIVCILAEMALTHTIFYAMLIKDSYKERSK